MSSIMQILSGVKVLETKHSPINGEIQVVKDLAWGTHIKVKGLTQSGGVVEGVWKTSLKKVAELEIDLKNCLILGLGGGTTANLVRKKWPSISITGIDLDPLMISLGEKYLKLQKDSVKTVVGDAYAYCQKLAKNKETFDLILVDLYQGSDVPAEFDTEEFARLVSSLVTKHGVVVFNRLFYGQKRVLAYRFLKKLEKIYPYSLPVYPEANVMYICRK